MDWNMFFQITLPLIAAFGWVLLRQEKLFDKIEAIGNRLNRLEEKAIAVENKVSHLDGMLSTIISVLIGHKTGTEK